MCGIFIYMCKKGYKSSISSFKLYDSFMKIKARGPDRSSFNNLTDYGVCLGFHRLAIMDTTTNGDQPFIFEDDNKQINVLCNGEIYNFKQLCEKYSIELKSGSDCEVILHLYCMIGLDAMIKELSGEFAFCICEIDKKTKEVKLFCGRDQLGIRHLVVSGSENEILICSELKASPFLFMEDEYYVDQFKPRHYLEVSNFDDNLFDLKYTQWLDLRSIPITIYDVEEAKKAIRESFEEGVDMMIDGERELCCFLSGGVDSSLVSSRVAQKYKEKGKVLRTFSIGLDSGSSDQPFAEMVAKHIGSDHTHVMVSEKDFLETVDEVIRNLESYDITTVRASAGQYLLAKWVSENTDIKIILGGDVSDEENCSYTYLKFAPSTEELYHEGIRFLEDIHMYDGARCDLCVCANGIEIRLPFGYKKLLITILSIDPSFRNPKLCGGVEKWILREAFSGSGYLPEEVLWRLKEAFSDGISCIKKSWYQILQENIETLYSDEELKLAQTRFKHLPPHTKEVLHYRLIFEKYFGKHESTAKIIPYFWLPKWCGSILEPSARVLDGYQKNI